MLSWGSPDQKLDYKLEWPKEGGMVIKNYLQEFVTNDTIILRKFKVP